MPPVDRFGLGMAAGGVLDRLFPERVTHHKKIITVSDEWALGKGHERAGESM